MQLPVVKVYITQGFGENPEAYRRFGLKGHNGLDFRAFLPSGERCYIVGKSEVLVPHEGIIIENAFDKNGYGFYVKIENDKEGSVLGHFGARAEKRVGEKVRSGEVIAYAGSSGNSTGIHVHWGYYQKPRQRSNGYNGFIDQTNLWTTETVQKSDQGEAQITISQKLFEELVTKASKYDEWLKNMSGQV